MAAKGPDLFALPLPGACPPKPVDQGVQQVRHHRRVPAEELVKPVSREHVEVGVEVGDDGGGSGVAREEGHFPEHLVAAEPGPDALAPLGVGDHDVHFAEADNVHAVARVAVAKKGFAVGKPPRGDLRGDEGEIVFRQVLKEGDGVEVIDGSHRHAYRVGGPPKGGRNIGRRGLGMPRFNFARTIKTLRFFRRALS